MDRNQAYDDKILEILKFATTRYKKGIDYGFLAEESRKHRCVHQLSDCSLGTTQCLRRYTDHLLMCEFPYSDIEPKDLEMALHVYQHTWHALTDSEIWKVTRIALIWSSMHGDVRPVTLLRQWIQDLREEKIKNARLHKAD